MSREEHRSKAPEKVGCAVLTVSDTRTQATDAGGRLIHDLLERAGHRAVAYKIVRDEIAVVQAALHETVQVPGCEAVLVTGGTGISPRDCTYEAVAGLLEKRLDGFGELFRLLSFEQIGPAAMLSRAVAGVFAGMAVFVMPGSPNAVRVAMERLILPELGHVIYEITKG